MSMFHVTDAEMSSVLDQFKQGHTAKEIAHRLNLSLEQVAWALVQQYPAVRRHGASADIR